MRFEFWKVFSTEMQCTKHQQMKLPHTHKQQLILTLMDTSPFLLHLRSVSFNIKYRVKPHHGFKAHVNVITCYEYIYNCKIN